MIRRSPFSTNDKSKCCFVMMRYRDSKKFGQIEKAVRDTLKKYHVEAGLAKDKAEQPLLWANVCAYMDNAKFGVAIFDNIACYQQGEPRANPNICMELGYMLAKGADCLILRDIANHNDKNSKLFADLDGHIVQNFNSNKPMKFLEDTVSNWIQQRISIRPIYNGFAQMFPKSKIALRIKEQQQEKLEIGHYLIKRWIDREQIPKTLLLDSGTTAAAIAEAIMLKSEKFTETIIYTNNLLVSLMLSSTPNLKCHVLEGVVDEDFACVFTDPPGDALPLEYEAAVISCTGFDKVQGPLANSERNLAFKHEAMKKCKRCYVVFGSEKAITSEGSAVFQKKVLWEAVLKQNVSLVITNRSRELVHIEKALYKALGDKFVVSSTD